MSKIVRFGPIALLGLVLSAFATPGIAAEKIVISQWDAYWPPDLLANFTAATGIEAEWAVQIDNEDMMGKVTASGGKGYDVVFASSPFVEALAHLGLIAELDHALIPNLANLYKEAQDLPYDPGNKHSVPYTWGTTGLCYRSDLVATEPTSWDDLLHPSDDLKGKITMLSTDRWLMAAGLKALGYSVNSTDADELAKTKALLIEAKKNLLAYDDTTFYAKLVSGEASLVHAWDGWCNFGIAENAAIKFVIPKEGSDLFVDTMVVTAASEHKEAAHAFINYVLRPEVHASIVAFTLYKVPNEKAAAMVDPSLLTSFPSLAIPSAVLFQQEMLRDLGDDQKAFTRVVTEIWRRSSPPNPGMAELIRRVVLLGPGVGWLALFLVAPCAIVLVDSFFERGTWGGIDYVFTFENYVRAADPLYLSILLNSAKIAAITTLAALLIGYPAAYLIATAPKPWQMPLLILVMLPFWSNYLIRTYAWIVLLNREGLINNGLRGLGLIDEPLPLLYNDFAIVVGLLYGYLPFMILALYSSISRLNREMFEASADLGASSLRTFRRVTLPLTLPGVGAGSVFVFVLSIGNFVTPDLLGGGRTLMVGNLIFDQFLSARDWPFGAALAFVLIGLMMVLLMVQAWVVNRRAGVDA